MGVPVTYFDQLCEAMRVCGERENAIFLGQGVANKGTSMSQTFRDVPPPKRLEMPVAEEMQMGLSIGMALSGYLPICVFPRWNFILRAADQLVNHLDRLPLYSGGGFRPKVIIRTAVPSRVPFNPGPQHDDDFSTVFERMFRTVRICRLKEDADIVAGYREALDGDESTLLVEYTDHYRTERANEK